MSIIKGDLHDVAAQAFSNAKIDNIQLIKELNAVTDFYKVQIDFFGGKFVTTHWQLLYCSVVGHR